MKHVLITGANGFIGSHLTERLLQDNMKVRCLVRKTSNLQWLKNLETEIVFGDIEDTESLENAVKGVDTIFHLAGRVKAPSEEAFFQANVTGTINLLKAAAKMQPDIKRFVFVSTLEAVGPAFESVPHNETIECRPMTPYGASKLAAEEAVKAFYPQLPVTIVRPPVVIGPRDKDGYEIFRLVNQGWKLLLGFKEKYGSFVDVSDLVSGLILSATNEKAVGQTYFIVSDPIVPVSDFENMIAEKLGKKALTLRLPVSIAVSAALFNEALYKFTGKETLINWHKVQAMKHAYWICAGDKAEKELGFRPAVKMEEAVAKTANWYREAGWLK